MDDIREYQLAVVKNILMEHKGADNPIYSKQISRIVGFPLEDTQVKCRKAIRKVAEKYSIPVVASKHGYYVANTKEELDKYMDAMDRRIAGIEHKKEMIMKNFG